MTAISCGETTTTSPKETENAAIPESVSSDTLSLADAHAAVKDDLPEADFGGENFVITINNYTGCESRFVAEETNGDLLNDAVYLRNAAVEERFHINFEIVSGQVNDMISNISKSVTAGDDYYQLCNQHVVSAVTWITGEKLYNW